MTELAFAEIEFNANLAAPRSAGSDAENFDELSMPAKNKTHNQQNQLTFTCGVRKHPTPSFC